MYGTPQAFMSTLGDIRISCRNNRTVSGRLKMYDKHFNMVVVADGGREVFIRGDGVVAISRGDLVFSCKILHAMPSSRYAKLPRRILILCADVRYFPTVVSEVDYAPRDVEYDLVVYVDKRFHMAVEHPFCIANAEIWFERGTALTRAVFERALSHYSSCEIRNGR